MKKTAAPARAQVFLGIEGGATRTAILAAECPPPSDEELSQWRGECGPANLRLMSDAQLLKHFRDIARAWPNPTCVAIGLAGARTESDRNRIRAAAAKAWPGTLCYATNDLETALAAADGLFEHPRFRRFRKKGGGMDGRRADQIGMIPRVLVLSGTGSCCFGKTWHGKTAKVGGWGHILGDKGSGYEIGLRALKAVVYYFDRDGKWSLLGQRVLRALQLNEPNELIAWVQNAGKTEIAALAVEVFNASAKRDKIASDILAGAADSLARDATACARRLVKPGTLVHFVFAGSVLLKQPRFAQQVSRRLRQLWPRGIITPLRRESVEGAFELAKQYFNAQRSTFNVQRSTLNVQRAKAEVRRRKLQGGHQESGEFEIEDLALLPDSPTEQRHPLSMNLDRLALPEAIALMLREDARIPSAILSERKKIERAVELIVRALKRGGRLFYVGAGTSGRLGVLDASECPPTFHTPPEMVQGIIAGGQRALWEAVEGAEDDPMAGASAVQFRGVQRRDVVVGIAASGRTPFVRGALAEAARRGAKTILLCFNPRVKIQERLSLIIAPNIGPEILTGSTRLKAGTATKLILNIFTTLAMVRLGKVLSNLMIDVKASNTKLRDRATRIVQTLTRVDYASAQKALEKSGWKIKSACARLRADR